MSQGTDRTADRGGFALQDEAGGEPQSVEGTLRVGRDTTSDVVLASSKASRTHAILFLEEGALWVEDQNSTNKTYVNGRQVEERTQLHDGDTVQFADVRYQVIGPAPAQPQPADDATVVAGARTIFEPRPASPQAGSDRAEQGAAPGASPAVEQPRPPAGEKSPAIDADAGSRQSEAPAGQGRPESKRAADEKPPAGGGAGAEDRAGAQQQAAPREEQLRGETPKAGEPEVAEPDPGASKIPASWADAEELEQASRTMFVSRARAAGGRGEVESTDPGKAVEQARHSISSEQPILVGLTEPVKGKVIQLHRRGDVDKWELGRNDSADIVIDNESVSSRHAQLVCDRGRWKIVNMMSVNGTFVNGRKVVSAYLNPHDRIRMGTVELVFDAPGKKSSGRFTTTASEPAKGSILSRLRQLVTKMISRIRSR